MSAYKRNSVPGVDTIPVVEKVLEALRGLRFGSVEITVHEGRIVQIERKEKARMNLPCPEKAEGGNEGGSR